MLFKNAVSTRVVIYLTPEKDCGQMSFASTYALLSMKNITSTEIR
jgi:hypothetical protein